MTIKTKVIINFTDNERIALRDAATLLSDFACQAQGVSDEISERFDEAYELIMDLLDLEG